MIPNDTDELQTLQNELLATKQAVADAETKVEIAAELVAQVAIAVQQLSLTSLLILRQYISKALALVGVTDDE